MGKLREGLRAMKLSGVVDKVALMAFLDLVVEEVEGPATLPSLELPPMSVPKASPDQDVVLVLLRLKQDISDIQCCSDCRRLGVGLAKIDLQKLATLLGVDLGPEDDTRAAWGHT